MLGFKNVKTPKIVFIGILSFDFIFFCKEDHYGILIFSNLLYVDTNNLNVDQTIAYTITHIKTTIDTLSIEYQLPRDFV